MSIGSLSCYENHKKAIGKIEEAKKEIPFYVVVEIEGCEYIKLENAYDYSTLSHKGNCKNPIHCHNQIASDSLKK